ncbi:MAG: hypothetical protein HOI35_05935 [Woeseia sp.]|nr:hypothetical protein [Woeseia sp.]MBT6209542.1 hypothetical protein [Woeseia sp.]
MYEIIGKKLLPALLASCVLTACASTGALISAPSVDLSSVQLEKMSLSQQTFLLGFDVNNPNAFPLPVRAIEYTVRFDDEKFAGGATEGNFTIPARGRDDFTISVDLDFLSTALQLSSLLRRGMPDTVNYALEGRLTVDIPFARPLSFSSSGVIDVQGKGF